MQYHPPPTEQRCTVWSAGARPHDGRSAYGWPAWRPALQRAGAARRAHGRHGARHRALPVPDPHCSQRIGCVGALWSGRRHRMLEAPSWRCHSCLFPGALALPPGSSLPSDEPGRHPVPIGRLQCGHAAMRLGWSHRMLRNPVSQVDDTMVWCEALRRAGVKGGINFEPKRKSAAARARHSLQQLVSPGAQG